MLDHQFPEVRDTYSPLSGACATAARSPELQSISPAISESRFYTLPDCYPTSPSSPQSRIRPHRSQSPQGEAIELGFIVTGNSSSNPYSDRVFDQKHRQHRHIPPSPASQQQFPHLLLALPTRTSSFSSPQPQTLSSDRLTGTVAAQCREERRRYNRIQKLERLIDEEDKMKFSHSIQFNAVPDWSNHYISYSNLKKTIYTLEKQLHTDQPGNDTESQPLLDASPIDPDATFRRMLDTELDKICSFYQIKELEIFGDVGDLLKAGSHYQDDADGFDAQHNHKSPVRRRSSAEDSNQPPFRNGSSGRYRPSSNMSASIEENEDSEDDDDDDHDESAPALGKDTRRRRRSAWDAMRNSIEDLAPSRLGSQRRPSMTADELEQQFSSLYESGIYLKKRTISLYVSLCELKSFIQLNKTGFAKAIKKYDKIMDRNLRRPYMDDVVANAYPFKLDTTTRLNNNIADVEKVYADTVTNGEISLAKRELRLHLREHVVWERNTVWREMIGIERKAQAANMGIRRTLLGGDHDPENARLQGDEMEVQTKELSTPVGKYRCPKWLFSTGFFMLTAIIGVFLALLLIPIMDKPEQQNCLAMLILVSLLWATEVIPLFVTSLAVPFLTVILRIMRADDSGHRRLDAHAATQVVFASMWTPVIMLLLGGFTIAAALSKYHIAKMMATFVLSKAGTRPRTVLLTNMFVGMILSMWISNVAAPVLCFSIIQPILRNQPNDSRFSKALILGIALASNIGGAASPIASPQNIIALQNMKPAPSWGTWFFVALPVCIVSIIAIWLVLLVTFKPGQGTTIVPIRPMKDRFTGIQWFITLVTLVTIILWCVSHQLEETFGDMGVIAIIPIVLFFGTGILTKEDFNNFLWTIIILAAGGLTLGKAVNSSGLLHTIAMAITEKVDGLSLYAVLVVFSALILVIATFISHTVAALIMLPLVQQVGANMDEPHPNLLVMGSALMCSAAMGLPTSGFPNMTAIMMEVPETGQRYLRVKHFISRGVPSSIIAWAIVVTLGYGLMLAIGL